MGVVRQALAESQGDLSSSSDIFRRSMEENNVSILTFILDGIENRMKEMESEISTLSFWRAVLAEFLSTFLILIIICSIFSTVSNDPDLPYSMAQVYRGLVTGLGIIPITTMYGAHMTPAISTACVL